MTHDDVGVVALTLGDELDSFTDFLALFAGWGVVVVVHAALLVMIIRQIVVGRPTRIQRVTIELFVAFVLLTDRLILLAYVFHRRDLPQPWRVMFWIVVLTLIWKFFYFALWASFVRPFLRSTWSIVIAPRLREIIPASKP